MKKVNVVVKKEFIDRYTGVKQTVGKELVITAARFREIKRSGDYVAVKVAEPKIKEKEK